jgi:hypothetical protein
MPAKPRNNIARLPRDQRLIVLDMLLDGATYDEVRSALLAAGVAESALPHNSSFLAYCASDEYKTSHAEAMQWRRKATEKRLLADALATGGGTSGMIDLALYEAAEQLRESLPGLDPNDLAKVSTALRGLKTALITQAREDRNAELDRLKAAAEAAETAHAAEVAVLVAELEAARAGAAVDPAAVSAALDKHLGVGK